MHSGRAVRKWRQPPGLFEGSHSKVFECSTDSTIMLICKYQFIAQILPAIPVHLFLPDSLSKSRGARILPPAPLGNLFENRAPWRKRTRLASEYTRSYRFSILELLFTGNFL